MVKSIEVLDIPVHIPELAQKVMNDRHVTMNQMAEDNINRISELSTYTSYINVFAFTMTNGVIKKKLDKKW